MLATLVIGLREGLEASLIVGIIAAFLRKNGKSLTPMWIGVALAVVLSVAVGVALDLIEKALPQAAQEGMEAVIGLIAIIFVTGMILWMNEHARDMKRQLESEAAAALSQTSAYALASMAFLAVLREGFETSVFLLATFSSAQSMMLAVTGAVVGLAAAVVIGWGIYFGGIKINLSKFFRYTGAFLILVAAGLVVTSLRSAHEAGWLNAGQQATVNLGWLVAPGTVKSALISGVLGIPADPRLIELLGWLAYLLPVSALIFWPQAHRPGPRKSAQLQLAGAITVAAIAIALVVAYPQPFADVPTEAPLVAIAKAGSSPIGTARLRRARGGTGPALTVDLNGIDATTLPMSGASAPKPQRDDGINANMQVFTSSNKPEDAASQLTIDDVLALNNGRFPVGLNARRNPGPFAADWTVNNTVHVWTVGSILLDANGQTTTVVTLSGGGLQTPRTITASNAPSSPDWTVSSAYRDRVASALRAFASARFERHFWAFELPIAMGLLAAWLAVRSTLSLYRQHCRRKTGVIGT